jgi:hypothetical protein
MKAMSISEALKYANQKLRPMVNDALSGEVLDEVADVEHAAIQSEVYDKYKPKHYVRRGARGGLLDTEHNLVINNASLKLGALYVENDTPPNPYKNGVSLRPIDGVGGYSTTPGDESIAGLVEYGIYNPSGYGYDYWPDAKARPFIEKTRKVLRGGKAAKALAEGLRRQGLQVITKKGR